MRRPIIWGLLLVTAGCAVNPATGRREFDLIGESREIEMGREADQQLASSLGLVDDPALTAYVADLGNRLAAVSERPGLPWSFRVLDDPTVNAFALPGGFIYVTRGILGHFESEAELAGVLGHEIGHVTARHSVTQMSRQQLQQLGLGVGMVFSEDFRQVGSLAGSLLQVMNLRYSRGDESESDELGLRYMSRAAYDGEALIGVFQMLANVSGGGEGRIPEWQLTHPYPENREATIRAALEAAGGARGGTVARDAYLDRLDGLTYGADPRQGFFRDGVFFHPELAFQFRIPDGWTGINQTEYVAAVSPEEDGVLMLTMDGAASDVDEALRTFLAAEGVTAGGVERGGSTTVPTRAADFSATTSNGTILGRVTYLAYDGRIYRMLGYAGDAGWTRHRTALSGTMESFDRVTDRTILDVRPWQVRIVPAPRNRTLRQLHEQWSVPASLEEWARLNRLDPDATVPSGTRIKRVEGVPYR